MEIILKEDVINLGYIGDIFKLIRWVTVVTSYTNKSRLGKCFSIKNVSWGLETTCSQIGKHQKRCYWVSWKTKDITLTVGAKTSSTGKIFGAVGPIQIADAYEKAGFTVDRKVIALKEPVKEIGSYKATLKLHKEVSLEIAFEVVSE